MTPVYNCRGAICITGGTGFLGKHVLRLLEEEREVRIRVLTRREAATVSRRKVEAIAGDLMDLGSVKGFVETGATVINLAYLNGRGREENVKAAQNLAVSCEYAGARRLIHASTAVVVGRTSDDVITEATACHPVTEYEKTKLEIECLLLRELEGKCPIVIVRPTEVFGEGGNNLVKLVKELIGGSSYINRLRLSLYDRRRLNLVCAENVSSAIWFLARMETSVPGECFIISDDEYEENNYADVAQMVTEELGLRPLRPVNIRFKPDILSALLHIKGRSNTNPQTVYSPEKLLRAGFRKPVSFREGIRRFLESYARGKCGAKVEAE